MSGKPDPIGFRVDIKNSTRTMQPLADEFDSLLWSCSSVSDCCLSCLCPHFYAFFVASKAGYSFIGSMMNFCCYPFCLCCLRQHAREMHGIDGGCCGDLTTTLCCPCCGYIQIKKQCRKDYLN